MNFREMVLVSLDEYKKLKTASLQKPGSTLQKDLNKLHEQYGEDLPDDQRIKLESEVISKHTGQFKHPQPVVTPQHDLFLRIIDSFAAINRKRALQIFHHLVAFFKHEPKWNDLGQIVNFNNEPIIGSNIVELIDYVTNTNRKTSTVPIGFDVFSFLLTESNMPRNFLSKPGLERLENNKQQNQSLDNSDYTWHSFR